MHNFIRMKQLMDLPPLVKFSDNINYNNLKILNKFTVNKSVLLKTLKELKEFTDYTEETVHNNKIKSLIVCFEELSPKALKIMRKYISEIHQLKEVIPNFNKEYKYQIINSLEYIQRYNKETFLEILSFLNHQKVLNAIYEKQSKKQILLEIEKIKQTQLKREETIIYKKEYGPSYKLLLEAKRKNKGTIFTYIKDMMFDELKFIKDPVVASFWGKETKCCLKKGGAASDLLVPIECSPLAGEIVGKLHNNKMSSYTWDMVECINGKAYKTLILDNIESPVTINEKDTEYLFDKLSSFDKYKTIYLGTVRNDCTVNEKYIKKPRQSLLPGFDYIFRKSMFTHADSDIVYKMREHKEDKEFKTRKMNMSDLHLCKYIEKYIYGEDIYNNQDDKTDILKQVTLDTPCYIIDSSTNIYGYMLTKWKYFNKNNEEVFNNTGRKRLYIEDLVISKDRKVLLELKNIFDDLKNWLLKNKIKEVYLNTNRYSKNFKKRLTNIGIKVIEEEIDTIMPINHLK